MELQLEDLEADASEDDLIAEAAGRCPEDDERYRIRAQASGQEAIFRAPAARTRRRHFRTLLLLDPGTAYPRFIEGERDCPPEDCGGIPGFYEMLEARADPNHPDRAEITQWLDEYDSDDLDVFPIQVALGRIAARRNAAARRIIKPAND